MIRLMNLPEPESEALKLAPADRARLAEVLLQSLDDLSAEENQRLWAEEAARRNSGMDENPTLAQPAEEVFRDARARLA
jgi:putative addiction module component (TIGR02574 family)